MKNLVRVFFLGFVIFCVSCGGDDDCMECTGTNDTGEMADFTICKNDDGTTTRTNNLDNTTTTDSVGYAEGVAFFESLGLDCK